MKEFHCGTLVPGCEWHTRAEDEALRHEPLQHRRERARVVVERARELPRGQPRVAPHGAHHEALRPRHAETGEHRLGHGLEPVVHGPQALEGRDALLVVHRSHGGGCTTGRPGGWRGAPRGSA